MKKEHVYQKDWAIIPPQKISCLIWSLSSILELPIYTVYIYIYIYIFMYTYLGPGTLFTFLETCLPFIFGGWKTSKNMVFYAFSNQNKGVICVQGNMYIYIYIYYIIYFLLGSVIFTNHPGECGWQVHEQQEFESNHFLGTLRIQPPKTPQNPRRWGGKQLEYGKVQPCQMALGTSKSGYKTLGISAISPCKKTGLYPTLFFGYLPTNLLTISHGVASYGNLFSNHQNQQKSTDFSTASVASQKWENGMWKEALCWRMWTQPFWIHVWYTPRKINGWNLKITQLKRKIIYKKPSFFRFHVYSSRVYLPTFGCFFNGKYIGRYTQSHGSCGTCFIAGTSGSTNPVVFVHWSGRSLCACVFDRRWHRLIWKEWYFP